jgi:transcriptional regulator with XRE-family HTH domain
MVQRRRLRVALRQARQDLGLTQKDVAKDLDWSTSKLLRIESGEIHVSVTDLDALLRRYGITDPDRVGELRAMAQAAKKQPWAAYRGVLSAVFMAYLGYEAGASVVRSFTNQLLPGLLQSEDYTRAMVRTLSAPDTTEEVIELRVRAKLARQELLSREDAPGMAFVIDEGVLRRRVGTGEVMAQQLEHLKKLATHPKIDVRVLPLGAGEHRAMLGSFVVLEFPAASDEDLLYIEAGHADVVIREGERDITAYKETFFELEGAAVPVEQLTQAIEDLQADMRATGGRSSLMASRR